MTRQQLITLLRAQLSDDDILVAALLCPDCGRQRFSLDRAVELARKVSSLQEWFVLMDTLEDKLASPPRALPSVELVRKHCEALARSRRRSQTL